MRVGFSSRALHVSGAWNAPRTREREGRKRDSSSADTSRATSQTITHRKRRQPYTPTDLTATKAPPKYMAPLSFRVLARAAASVSQGKRWEGVSQARERVGAPFRWRRCETVLKGYSRSASCGVSPKMLDVTKLLVSVSGRHEASKTENATSEHLLVGLVLPPQNNAGPQH